MSNICIIFAKPSALLPNNNQNRLIMKLASKNDNLIFFPVCYISEHRYEKQIKDNSFEMID